MTASQEDIAQAYDDILTWLGFPDKAAYHTALSSEGDKVFRRGLF